MGRPGGLTAAVLACLACLGAPACGGPGGASVDPGGAPDVLPELPDTLQETPDPPPLDPGPGGPDDGCPVTIQKVDPPEMPVEGFDVSVVFLGERDLRARAVACGKPARDVWVEWALTDDGDGVCALETAASLSGDDGIATARLRQVDDSRGGECEATACLPGGDCLRYRIQAGRCGLAPALVVGFSRYEGRWPGVSSGTAWLFRQGAGGAPRCADLPWQDPASSAVAKKGPVSLLATVQFETLPGLERDGETRQDYAVLCLAGEGGTGPVRALGCLDDVAVELGARTFVECPLADLPPGLAGTWDLRGTFDLLTGLPPPVETVMDLHATVLSRPRDTVLRLLCDPSVAVPGSAARDLCAAAFRDPDNPLPGDLAPAGLALAAVVDANLAYYRAYACPEGLDPALCPVTRAGVMGAPRWRSLEAVEFVATLACAADPGPDGAVPGGACAESFTGMVVRGLPGRDCTASAPWCREASVSLSSVPGLDAAIDARPEVSVDPAWGLSLGPHPLALRYGALTGFVLEKLVLPPLFGDGADGLPAVDSWEAFLASLLAGRACLQARDCCAAFGAAMEQAGSGIAAGAAEAACDAWVSRGGDLLRGLSRGLDADPSAFRLGTPADAPCPVHDRDGDGRGDALGSAEAPCAWEAEWTIGALAFRPAATFTGTRAAPPGPGETR